MRRRDGLTHPPPEGFDVTDHHLGINGRLLSDLADEIGETPFYVYGRNLIDRRIQALRAALPGEVELHYAIKANPHRDVVQFISERVDGLDVASAGELDVALATAIDPAEISFAGPGKTRREIEYAILKNIVLNVESPGELDRVVECAQKLGRRPRIALRVNPDFELKTSGMRMSGGPKPFGIDAEQIPQLLAGMPALPVEFLGFHIFSGSQNLSVEAIAEAQTSTIDLAIELSRYTQEGIQTLNIGGGLGIPYFPGDRPLDLSLVGSNLAQLMPRVRAALPRCRVIMELGRYIVGEAGIYVARIIDRKISRGQVFLITDGGLHHHLALSGNFGQVIRKNYPVALANKYDLPAEETVNIVGCLCTPLDRLADQVALPKAEVGDLVAVFQSGAYGLTASPINFLSHQVPQEIFV